MLLIINEWRSLDASPDDLMRQQLEGSLLNFEITGIFKPSLMCNGKDVEKWGLCPHY